MKKSKKRVIWKPIFVHQDTKIKFNTQASQKNMKKTQYLEYLLNLAKRIIRRKEKKNVASERNNK